MDKSSSEPDIDGARSAQSIDPLQARVDGAAFALLREGRNPTVSLVRARMGGGSPNVVAPALQRWRLSFAGQLDENAGSALEVLPPGVLELVQALWSRALFEAHRVRADARSTADALEQLTEAIQDLRNRAARLAKREAALDAELRDLKKQRRRSTKAHSTRRRLTPKAMARPVATVPLKPKRSEPTATQPGKHRGHVARTAHKSLSRARRAAPPR